MFKDKKIKGLKQYLHQRIFRIFYLKICCWAILFFLFGVISGNNHKVFVFQPNDCSGASLQSLASQSSKTDGVEPEIQRGFAPISEQELRSGWILLWDGRTFFGWKAAYTQIGTEIDSKTKSSKKVKAPVFKMENNVLSVETETTVEWETENLFPEYELTFEIQTVQSLQNSTFPGNPTHTEKTEENIVENINEKTMTEKNIFFRNWFDSVNGREIAFSFSSETSWTKFSVVQKADFQNFSVCRNGQSFLIAAFDSKTGFNNSFLKQKNAQNKNLSNGLSFVFPAGKYQLRNVKIRPLGSKLLFNGKDFSGWNTHPEKPIQVSVNSVPTNSALTSDAAEFNKFVDNIEQNNVDKKTIVDEKTKIADNADIAEHDAEIHLQGGNGMLETERQWRNFALQLEYKTLSRHCNSGLFFRTIPGSNMDGYECQINNLPLESDRNKFLGNDAGSIFRFCPARRVLFQDGLWTSLTLIVNGNQFRTWINGVPVLLWKDERKENVNPRRGCSLNAGTIQLQGHDPQTDVLFRALRISEFSN